MQGIAVDHREVVSGVEVAVLQIFVGRAVDSVATALHDLIELAAGGVTELGGDLILLHAELGHGIEGDSHQGSGDAAAVVIDAFDGEVVVTRTLSADRGAGAQANGAARADAGVEQREVDHAAGACDRQIGDRG